MEGTAQKPTIGRIVIYRSKTGDYDVPAIVNCTTETISQKGVELGHVPPLTSPAHVHLTVLTPGKPGTAREGNEPNPAQRSGTYQEWDIPPVPVGAKLVDSVPPGTWRWPERV